MVNPTIERALIPGGSICAEYSEKQTKANNIDWVVKSGLCTRCGACHGVCPYNGIEWDGALFPHTTVSCQNCGLCMKVCGGIGFDYPRFSAMHYGYTPDMVADAIGPVKYSIATHSTSPMIRRISSSGGLASQILISLLKSNEIDGAVVTGFENERPLVPIAKIVRDRQGVLWGVQSKYVVFPVAHLYREIIEVPGRYAVVGLPCQIHSLRKWQAFSSEMRERVVLVVGLCCHANLEIRMLKDLISIKRIPVREVKEIEFRGGHWPGGIRITLKDGTIRPLHSGDIKDGAFNYLKSLYIASRCLLCPDYSAEFADISISDPWIRDEKGGYLLKGGWSIAHVRTKRGSRVIEAMKLSGDITTMHIPHDLILKNNKSMTAYKKRQLFIRLYRRKRKGLPCPSYKLVPRELHRKDYLLEGKFQFTLVGWYLRPLRRPLLRFAFSSLGERIKLLRALSKKHARKVFAV